MSGNGPAPSKLVFLHDLAKLPRGSKVRFLGYVTEYNTHQGSLTVEHAYPEDAQPTPRATVDVRLVLETVTARDLQVGRWLNIIGYIVSDPWARKRKRLSVSNSLTTEETLVQAILIWNAGAIRLANYEPVLARSQIMQNVAACPITK